MGRDGTFGPVRTVERLGLRPLLLPLLDATIDHSYTLIAGILLAEEWCRLRRVKGIVVPQDGGVGVRSLIAGAALAGAQSFSVQYGYATDSPEISEPIEDLALLNGEFTKQRFLRRGASPAKLAVVGSTAYDRVIAMRSDRQRLRLELARRYNLDPDRRWLVVATWHVQAVYPESTKDAELALIVVRREQVAGRSDSLQAAPIRPGGWKEGNCNRRAFRRRLRLIGDLAENESLMCAADAVVCNYTTLAIMAIVAKTPVVIVDLIGIQKAPNRAYVDEGVAEHADSASSAETALQTILGCDRVAYWERRSDCWNRFIADRLYKDDGQSVDRVLGVIDAKLKGP